MMEGEQRVKRFRHKSYKELLKEVHLPSTLHQKPLENEDVEDNDSLFHGSLDHWRQLNLAPSFLKFANKVDPLCLSMPLLLHNWREIVNSWIEAVQYADSEGLKALLDLLQKLVADLRTVLLPEYHTLLSTLLGLLPQNISTDALTILLSALTAFFKYILLPSLQSDSNLLEETWAELGKVMKRCLPDIQRAAAEVWGAVLRRLKGNEVKERAMFLLAENLEGLESSWAIALIHACKSVSQTLHTCTASLIRPLLTYHLTSSTRPGPTHILIRRSLTAFIHHVKSADQLTPVVALVIDQFDSVLRRYAEESPMDWAVVPINEQLRRVLEVVVVPCSVRQGSRLTHSQLEQLFALLPLVPLTRVGSKLVPALLRFTAALYMASDMAFWLGPGRTFLQRCWDEGPITPAEIDVGMQPNISPEHQLSSMPSDCSKGRRIYTSFTLPLHASLAELSWGGWKLVALPLVLKHTLPLFPSFNQEKTDEDTPMILLAFLASLRRFNKLGPSEVDIVWRERLEKWCIDRVGGLAPETDGNMIVWTEKKAAEISDLIALYPFFSSAFTKSVVHLANKILYGASLSSKVDSAWFVSTCLRGLASCDGSEWMSGVDISTWTINIMKNWAWSADVLGSFVDISCRFSSKSVSTVLADVYPFLQSSLMSHSRPLRLAALRLLGSILIQASNNTAEVIKRCIQAEEASLDIHGVRERVVRIERVGQVVADEEGADICTRWLIAQLKINLRPVWAPTATAISSLAPTYGDLIWRLILHELRVITTKGRTTDDAPLLTSWAGMGCQDCIEDSWEEERAWRDSGAHKLQSVVFKWIDESRFLFAELRKAFPADGKFDRQSYEIQLLATLRGCPSLAEKHNRELISFFLSLTSEEVIEGEPSTVLVPRLLPRPKLSGYLNLFSKFSNPRALFATETLRALYVTLLSHPDRSLQSVSLSCLLTYKSPVLRSHEEKLKSLLDEANWRDQLATFDINALEQSDREEIVDVVIRLLFGKMLESRGRARGIDRRATILATLATCNDEELGLLVELMLKPLGIKDNVTEHSMFELNAISEKQQLGFLTLLGAVLKNLGTRLPKYWPALIGVTVDLIANAHKRINSSIDSGAKSEAQQNDELSEQEAEADEGVDDEPSSSLCHTKRYRLIRQLGLKRFADFVKCPIHFDFSPFLESSFTSFISPRLASLDKENTQAPSALLELFFSWSRDARYIRYLVEYDPRTLPKVYDCLIATNVKPAVISRVFDIVDNVLEHSVTNDEVREQVLKPHVSLLLMNLSTLVERSKDVVAVSGPIGQRQIGILSSVAQYLTNERQASTLIALLIPLLRSPPKKVPERIKVDLVKIIGDIMPLVSDLKNPSTTMHESVYSSLSMLFQSLRSRPGRIVLVSTFRRLAALNPSLEGLSTLVEDLNAYSTKRVEEPDFDRRLTAFINFNENLYISLSVTDWLPILYNSMYFIQDHEELAVRSNASLAMSRFIGFVASPPSPDFEHIFLRILLPGLKNGLRSKNELVRAEILGVIAYAVAKCEHIGILRDMQILLAGGDEEANFFNNVLHLQVHRRSRALHRLAEFCDEGHFRSSHLVDIFVPLVEHFITSSLSVSHHLVNDAIQAIGHMAKRLSWAPYHALVHKYVKLFKAKDETERIHVRTLVAILDNFHFPMEEIAGHEVEDANADGDEESDVQVREENPGSINLASKATTRIADAVNGRLLPTLLEHLKKHDPTTDDNARLPIAIGIVKVAKHLPESMRELQITRLLTILSQILRSRSQETRDLARDALQRIAVILGSSYLPQIIRELRGALVRGPQLHVLASVTHALLVHVTSGEHAKSFDNMDNCVNDIAYVSTEVIFGESGKDVQVEGFKTKMREVRSSSSKGLDSFGIVARLVTPPKISSLLSPLRGLMQETESAKTMKLVDEVLKRIAGGLNSNIHLVPKELIVLCHTLISQNAKFLQQVPKQQKRKAKKDDTIVQTKRDIPVERDHFANNSYRFVAFGLDLLHTALRRTRFDLEDSEIMKGLNSMIVVVGNTLYSTNAPVIVLGLRCVAGLTKCPLPSLAKSLPVFVNQALDIIRQTGNMEAEVVRVAFKALATIFRDGPPVQVREKDLIYLLELLMPDIEEPSQQASVFIMLRAIVARKFVVPEIYDVMEKVSEVMVTSQSLQVQELCRGVLLQFLLDYPQGKGRLRTQMTFLAKNLSYVHESGRKSVMELLNAMISKFQVDFLREYSDLLFVALVMVVSQDDSSKCREMASQLIKSLFMRLDDDRRRVLFSHLHSWVTQRRQLQLARASSQIYGFIVEVLQAEVAPYLSIILQDLRSTLGNAMRQMEMGNDEEDAMQVDIEWQLPYHTLSVLFKVARALPDFDIKDQIPWSSIVAFLLFPHAWVRNASARLLGLLFVAVPIAIPRHDLPKDHPLSDSGMREAAEKFCLQLKSEHLDEVLSLQTVKNLFYVGKCFYCLPIRGANELEDEVEGDDDIGDEAAESKAKKQSDPLPWLFSKLSYQIRSAYIARRNKSESPTNWHQQVLAILRWFAAMTSHMEAQRLEKFLVHVLSPIYRLTEDDTIRDPQIDEIKTLAIELQDLVQNKVGVVKFSSVYNQIRQGIMNVQKERKTARALRTASNPEAAAKRKLQRNLRKKASKKRKERTFADTKRARKRIRL